MDTIKLKERKRQAQEAEAKLLCALTSRKKALADAKRRNRQRKKPVAELLSLLALTGCSGFILRPARDYIPKSHNLDKQRRGLLAYLFVRYPVPPFLYQAFLLDLPDGAVYRNWFVTLAQGGSFPKAVRGVMTR